MPLIKKPEPTQEPIVAEAKRKPKMLAQKANQLASMSRLASARANDKALKHEGGAKFYFKHLAPKARANKRIRRRMARESRRGNRK